MIFWRGDFVPQGSHDVKPVVVWHVHVGDDDIRRTLTKHTNALCPR